MPGPIEAAGAVRNPSKYGALGMGGRQFTGLVTQRSPYRDGAVPYLVGKFYGGSRFDTILDGLNREISQRLTDVRSPGSSVYNALTFPAVNSFYAWKYIQNDAEVVRTIIDGADGAIYDATPGQKSTLFTKTAGAGRTRFLGVNTELFLGDGVDTKKMLQGPITWRATKNVLPGTLINQGALPGVMYMALGGMTLPIVGTAIVHIALLNYRHFIYVDPQKVPENFANLIGASVTFSGLTQDTNLNGQTLPVEKVISSTLGIFSVVFTSSGGDQDLTADTGNGTTGNGTTGGGLPAFDPTRFAITADAGQQWKSYGSAVQNWGIAAPTAAPTVTPQQGARWWRPGVTLSQFYSVLDANGNIQVAMAITPGASGYFTGLTYPVWNSSGQPQAPTIDGTIIWWNLGKPGTWIASSVSAGLTAGNYCVVDSNGNLQAITDDYGGVSGATEPVWGTTLGSNPSSGTDGSLTWTCLLIGYQLTTATVKYAFSFHGIDGSVSTASPAAVIQGGVLGPLLPAWEGGMTGNAAIQLEAFAASVGTPDTQCDQIWVWRTAQGQATLILDDQVPIEQPFGRVLDYGEPGIPDVSATGSGELNAFIAAPVAHTNDPPASNMTAPAYYLQRTWGIVDNKVVYSGGPDTLVGNGNTAFPPLNEIPFLAQPIRLLPVLVQNGGLIVMTTSGVKIILGTGTASNPFYVGDYLELVSILNYDAVSVFYNQIFCMESNRKVSSLAIQYPFNPQTGYTEVGFPIGDQFVKTTTGGQNSVLFDPATAYVSWNANSSADTGMYVSNGTGFWFPMSLINPPESGILWSPLRQIVGGASAVQSLETTPGVRNLLIGPPAGTPGPILMRDTTSAVWTDDPAGTPTSYPSWDAKGVNLLCSTGQWAEVVHISTKSKAVGKRPIISVLLNEIAPSAERPYQNLNLDDKSNDPSKTPRSISVFSDRYVLKQSGANTLGDCLLTKFDYGEQAEGDELLDWGILARVHEEREEEAATVR